MLTENSSNNIIASSTQDNTTITVGLAVVSHTDVHVASLHLSMSYQVLTIVTLTF